MRKRIGFIGVAAVAVLSVLTPSANAALVISFDGPGYSSSGTTTAVTGATGTAINGQGDTSIKWNDPGTNFAVVANAGNGGGNSALVSATSQVSTQSITYTPSLASLGVAGFTTASQQNFSMDLRRISNGGLSSGTELYRLQIGLQSSSVYPVYLRITAGGSILALNSSSATLMTISGALADNQYHTLSGSIDYSTNQYILALDGVTQGSPLAFATGSITGYGQFKLNVRQTSSTAGIAIDNVQAAVVVPEPTLMAVAGVGCGIGLMRRRPRAAARS